MKYQTIFRRTALLLLAAGALLAVACDGDKEPTPPTLDVKPGEDAKTEPLRLISYNILEGMKKDKDNNFDNFVAWVSEKAPDMLALEEVNYFTEASLLELAKRWGHNYAVLCKETGYPVALTSKYEIKLVNRMLGDNVPLWHGALHLQVHGLNIVVLHLYPFGSYPQNTGEAGSGEAYRVREISYILDQTLRKYPTEKNWLMMGDFNSYSPLDEPDYKAMGRNHEYDVHKVILASGYYDTLRRLHNYFTSSTSGGTDRIDYIFASQTMLPNITGSGIIKDAYTTSETASDHYPCLLDFRRYTAE